MPACPLTPLFLVSLQCEHRELFIRHIQGLSLEVQSELAAAIQEVWLWTGIATWGHHASPTSWVELLSLLTQVTQPGAGMVLSLSGPEPGELAPPELEMLSQNLMGTLLRLSRERDVAAQVGGSKSTEGQVAEWKDNGDPDVWGKWGLRLSCGVGVGGLGPAGLQEPHSAVVRGGRCVGHRMCYF